MFITDAQEAIVSEILSIAKEILTEKRVRRRLMGWPIEKEITITISMYKDSKGPAAFNIADNGPIANIDCCEKLAIVADHRKESPAHGTITLLYSDPDFFTKLRSCLEAIRDHD